LDPAPAEILISVNEQFTEIRTLKPKDLSPTSPVATAPAESTVAIVRAEPDALVRSAKGYATEARARGTRTVYAKHWAAFTAWCAEQGVCELPAAPQTVALYLAARADDGRKVATLGSRLPGLKKVR
jgi:hypothetical protein